MPRPGRKSVQPTSAPQTPNSPAPKRISQSSAAHAMSHNTLNVAEPDYDWSTLASDFEFQIHFHPSKAPQVSKKRKRASRGDDTEPMQQDSPFREYLNTTYSVSPGTLWNAARRYRKFTIRDQLFDVGDIVLVHNEEAWHSAEKPSATDPPPARRPHSKLREDLGDNWVGKVLEVRAGDEQHVYLRVYWLYRPEDLPSGRKWYHGENEVIPSNYMQIIDAMSVNNKIDVVEWKETNDEDNIELDKLFWRQTFNAQKKHLSELRHHCTCHAPYNPDSLLINCNHCGKWLHKECIETAASKKAALKAPTTTTTTINTITQPKDATAGAETDLKDSVTKSVDEDEHILAVDTPANGDASDAIGASTAGAVTNAIADAITGVAASAAANASKLLPRRRSNTKVKRKSKADIDMDGNGDSDGVLVDGKAGKNYWTAVVKESERSGKSGERTYEVELTELVDGVEAQKRVEGIVCLACLKNIE